MFDFDGTIADTFETGYEILLQLAVEFNFRQIGREELEKLRGMRTLQVMRYLRISPSLLSKVARRGTEELSLRMDAIQPLPGAPEVLHDLKARGFKMGIVTSNTDVNVHKFLRNHDLEIFDFIRSSSKLMGKAREIRACLRQLRLPPEDVLVVGDENRDIEAAQQVGVPMAALSWGYNSRASLEELKPSLIFDRMDQLGQYLTSPRA